MEKATKKQEYYSSAPWDDNYESTSDTDSGQDVFEDCLFDSSQIALSFLLLLKLIYASVIYTIIIFDSGMNAGHEIVSNFLMFMLIAVFVCAEDYPFQFKLRKSNSIYGTKTYVIMGIYIILTLFCFFLRYNHLIKDDGMLLILVLANLSNEGLAFIDCLKMEQKNYVKLSGLNYIWMILMPILIMLRDYINLPSWYIIFILGIDFFINTFIEYVSVICWIVYH
jgi:membrane protein